ncbi:hypothetical protein [Deinococcus maricopensis]|uniref:Uncharacterized protein n=1 Tax=Deinococcus maricopensis (strain DSM 21211 / LMG 22137 / NRRL B-23946 / LB-34) TaxID=709986 RepID=E8U599_DEIML|nr:hypothetical protein [Deinococcus maricopensis]ADV66238.1 hypothetical protein Deima_0579 [Deinococcus maricopensis DSM 21211]
MTEHLHGRVRKILDLAASGKLADEDAAQLLGALHPRLAPEGDAVTHVLALARTPDFGPDLIAGLLTDRALPGARRPPRPPGPPSWNGIDDFVDRVTTSVEGALDFALDGRRGGKRGTPGRPGTTLRVEVEDSHGNDYRLNLPLALAEHAPRLLPPAALGAIERAGLNEHALTLLLSSQPAPGEILSANLDDGTEVRLVVQ